MIRRHVARLHLDQLSWNGLRKSRYANQSDLEDRWWIQKNNALTPRLMRGWC